MYCSMLLPDLWGSPVSTEDNEWEEEEDDTCMQPNWLRRLSYCREGEKGERCLNLPLRSKTPPILPAPTATHNLVRLHILQKQVDPLSFLVKCRQIPFQWPCGHWTKAKPNLPAVGPSDKEVKQKLYLILYSRERELGTLTQYCTTGQNQSIQSLVWNSVLRHISLLILGS